MPNKIQKKRLRRYYLGRYFNKTARNQRKRPLDIPVIIINFNQLYYLKQLVDFLVSREFSKIVIIDNNSDYPPLIEYYKELGNRVIVERMNQNYGHMVFFEVDRLYNTYGNGYFFLTDADIVPNPNLPINFPSTMIKILDLHKCEINKVGFALDLSDIPDCFPLKEKVLSWESIFWDIPIAKDIYDANVDTTFALYPPKYRIEKKGITVDNFYKGMRMAGDYTAKHGGWYIDPKNLSPERKHYFKTSNSSASWKFDEEGNLDSNSNY